MIIPTAEVFVLKRSGPSDDLDGYAFEDEAHAHRWMTQPLRAGEPAGDCEVVRVRAWPSQRRCGCCGEVHWWMQWRGQRRRVSGAWKPPYGEARP